MGKHRLIHHRCPARAVGSAELQEERNIYLKNSTPYHRV